jgi:hypothetical protein
MIKLMSLTARRELLASVRQRYSAATWLEKGKILDGFVAATDYERKYACRLLSSDKLTSPRRKRTSPQLYDEQVRQALIAVWCAANKICSKRLVPFLPQLITVMEKHGHLRLSVDVRKRLLKISASTVDRMLSSERECLRQGISTTRPGSLLKHQIQVRTFADWDDVIPGFIEADLVAHCGGNTNGQFLNTLTLVDICTGWLELMPLLRKSAKDVIEGLRVAEDLLPFRLQGLDTDCGSEFINYDVLNYCEENNITFTRARTHRKNDQAHVEEKNGSVVRRLVGYDRYQGMKAWEALTQLYCVLRKYINFFQPSLKLLEKERRGAKVSKKYDSAKTPFQRVLLSEHVEQPTKNLLTQEYEALDPVALLAQIERLQDQLWQHSCSKTNICEPELIVTIDDMADTTVTKTEATTAASRYYRSSRKIDLRCSPRTWRTRIDPFEKTWDEIRLRLELMPETTATDLICWLMSKYPDEYALKQTRTLQRRIAQWRLEQEGQEKKMRALIFTKKSPILEITIKTDSAQPPKVEDINAGEEGQALA